MSMDLMGIKKISFSLFFFCFPRIKWFIKCGRVSLLYGRTYLYVNRIYRICIPCPQVLGVQNLGLDTIQVVGFVQVGFENLMSFKIHLSLVCLLSQYQIRLVELSSSNMFFFVCSSRIHISLLSQKS